MNTRGEVRLSGGNTLKVTAGALWDAPEGPKRDPKGAATAEIGPHWALSMGKTPSESAGWP
jgi:hypothetical protein